MKSLKQRTEIQQACLDGKVIRLKSYENDTWIDCIEDPEFDWFQYDYEVKPEPLERWTNSYDSGYFDVAYKTKEEAFYNIGSALKTIKMVEVVE